MSQITETRIEILLGAMVPWWRVESFIGDNVGSFLRNIDGYDTTSIEFSVGGKTLSIIRDFKGMDHRLEGITNAL